MSNVFIFIIAFLGLTSSVSLAGGTEYGIVDFSEVPSGLKSTVKFYIYNNTKKATRLLEQQNDGDGFSMNTKNCSIIGARKTCSILFTFDSTGLGYGSKTGFAQVQLSNNIFFELTLKAIVAKALQTPMGDKEAEDEFSARIPEGTNKLNALLKKQLITVEQFNTATTNLTRYKDLTFDYTRQYYRYCQPVRNPSLFEDSDYADRIRYMANIFKTMIANSEADFSAITPEVTDYVPAKTGCKGKPEDILKCTQANIAKRMATIRQSITDNHPHNPEPYRACADLGKQTAVTYSLLVGVFHHKKLPLKNQEIADIQDKMLGLTEQDLTEGY
ncbi:MAG: hypothetical protein ACM3MG_04450 [Bacillota bacterium]